MSKKLRFIWIDDEPKRKNSAASLEQRLGVKVEFKDVKNKKLDEVLSKVVEGAQPDLILMDHKLEDVESVMFTTGSTAASYLQGKWPECPVVAVTAVGADQVDSRQRSSYEHLCFINKISKYDKTILSIAKGFRKLKENRPENVDNILNLMKAPKEEYDRLKAIMPKELKENFADRSLFFDISHWIRGILIERPGFFYDNLWVATFLGIKKDSFSKVEDLFTAAKYKGVFMDESRERWWKSKILAILSKKVQEIGLPWDIGRKLPRITKADFSMCYVSKGGTPETVAYIDETENVKRYPMRLSNTISHPNYDDLLFFEEIRMMKPAE